MRKINIGSIETGQEFIFDDKTYKRVGYYLWGIDSPVKDKLYSITKLYNICCGYVVNSNQNYIIVQEKETGMFCFADCREECIIAQKKVSLK